MSDLQDLIHTNAHNAYEIGVRTERERIIRLLEPLAEHDEMCYDEGKINCYFEDCHASDYKYAIELIKGEQK
jgi:hypothetical protein